MQPHAHSRGRVDPVVPALQVHALLLSGGLNAALPGVLMRSQSASAMLQHQLAPLAARQAAAMLNKVRSLLFYLASHTGARCRHSSVTPSSTIAVR